ncbi:hypothetical protein BJX99DRAFT_259191 [Aspergillus californicus]
MGKTLTERIVEIRNNSTDNDLHDVKPPPSAKCPGRRRRRVGGWKRTLYFGSIWASTILILNLVMLIWASTLRSPHGSSVLYSGDCDRTKQISAGVHVVINMLSTGMLGASHFAMQCLSAPAREDVDRAHAGNTWLDIGVPSVRNLLSIPRLRRWLWLGLLASSVPLHLFYNSTVYSTISVNSYDVFVGNSSFTSLQPSDVAVVYGDYGTSWETMQSANSAQRMVQSAHAGNLTRLTPQDCITAYATDWQSKYGSVALISSEFNGSRSAVHFVMEQLAPRPVDSELDPLGWICQETTYLPDADIRCQSKIEQVKEKANSTEGWVVDGYKVDYCLVEQTPEMCTLEYSLPLSILVLATNFVKIGLILLTILILRANPLLTLGDSIASFLDRPDDSSRGISLLTRDVVVAKGQPVFKEDIPEYDPQPRRRWTSVSKERWAVTSFMYISSAIIALVLLLYGLAKMKATKEALWTSGFATIDTRTMVATVYWPSSLISNSLIANIPHLLYSSLYFLLNGVLTTMSLSTEWSSFAIARKGLRVSTPVKGSQRRARFLSLPRRYSLPLLAVSGSLHWLISQSIFLVRVLARDAEQRRDTSRDTTTVGYSPPAILTGLCVGLFLPAGVASLALRRFKSGMPVVGSCSLAIAAACHPSGKRMGEGKKEGGDGDGDDDEKLGVEYDMLQWGVELYGPGGGGVHCVFSDGVVFEPIKGSTCP